MNIFTKITIGIAIVLGFASSVSAQEVVLRYSEWLPAKYFMNERVLRPYFKDIERVTKGRVKVEISASPYGPPPRNYQMTVDGIADMTWGLHGYTPGTFPFSEMIELPGISTNAEADNTAYWRVFKKYFEPAGLHPGVHTLAVHSHPAGALFNSVRPVTSLEDFSGLKIRSANSSVVKIMNLLGATPIAIPVTGMHDALSKGVVDGVSLTDEAIYNFRISKMLKYETTVPGGLYNSSFFIVVNENKWNQISKADQKAIDAISGEVLVRKIGAVWQAEQDAGTVKALADGIKIHNSDGEFLATIMKRLSGLEGEWLDKAKKAGIDSAAALAMYRAEQHR